MMRGGSGPCGLCHRRCIAEASHLQGCGAFFLVLRFSLSVGVLRQRVVSIAMTNIDIY